MEARNKYFIIITFITTIMITTTVIIVSCLSKQNILISLKKLEKYLVYDFVEKDLGNNSLKQTFKHDLNILGLLMFHQIFLSPQVKRRVIISNKDSIYDLPQELPNDF